MKRTKRMILAALLLALATVLTACASNEGTYNAAMKLLNKGKYAKAAEKFEGLGSYGDATQMALYARAQDEGEKGNYKDAIATLTTLGNFKEAQQLASYYSGRKYEEWYDVDNAIAMYETIPLFRDSKERMEKVEEFKGTVLAWGTCGAGLNWRLYPDGLLTVGGYGKMARFASADSASDPLAAALWAYGNASLPPWHGLDIVSVVIQEGVTEIGFNAFDGCGSLTSVTISDSVTAIGNKAFQACIWLKSVTIPASVTSIGEMAFAGCISLASVTIPASVTSIGFRAFFACPESLTIHGKPGSAAEAYAMKNDINFAN